MPTSADIQGQRAFGSPAEVQPNRTAMRLLVIEDDRDAALTGPRHERSNTRTSSSPEESTTVTLTARGSGPTAPCAGQASTQARFGARYSTENDFTPVRTG